MINDEWWIRSLEELQAGGAPQDLFIVEMENNLSAYSFQGNSEISRQAAGLRALLLHGCFPLDELYGFCKGRKLSLRKLEKQLEEQSTKIRLSPIRAFIAQPFWAIPNDYYEKIIRPGCYWEGVNPIRIDREETESSLTAKIEKGLKEANLFVADLTENSPNVFYEIGHFEGRGIEGLFLSLEPAKTLFYTGTKDIIEIKRGPDGVADSRRRLREGLRAIKMKFLR
jgi:hypothetical protein